jgi:hypothetical protein
MLFFIKINIYLKNVVMKVIKKQIRPITFLFGILIMLQSCVAYKSQNFTLEEAAKTDSKVKVHTVTNENLKFKRVGVENGQYYGVRKVKGELVKVPLDRTMLNKINVKDKTISTILNSTLGFVGAIGALVLVVWIGDGAN